MKNILLTLLVCFSLMKSNAQAPQGIPYQSVIRNGSGALLINQAVNVRFSIHDSTMLGTIVYQETHTTTTSNLGMITLSIGQGTPSTGMFSSINWGNGAKFMQVELDAAGGNNYIDLGTQQMMSVPYALYAEKSASNDINIPNPKMLAGSFNNNGNIQMGSGYTVTKNSSEYTITFNDSFATTPVLQGNLVGYTDLKNPPNSDYEITESTNKFIKINTGNLVKSERRPIIISDTRDWLMAKEIGWNTYGLKIDSSLWWVQGISNNNQNGAHLISNNKFSNFTLHGNSNFALSNDSTLWKFNDSIAYQISNSKWKQLASISEIPILLSTQGSIWKINSNENLELINNGPWKSINKFDQINLQYIGLIKSDNTAWSLNIFGSQPLIPVQISQLTNFTQIATHFATSINNLEAPLAFLISQDSLLWQSFPNMKLLLNNNNSNNYHTSGTYLVDSIDKYLGIYYFSNYTQEPNGILINYDSTITVFGYQDDNWGKYEKTLPYIHKSKIENIKKIRYISRCGSTSVLVIVNSDGNIFHLISDPYSSRFLNNSGKFQVNSLNEELLEGDNFNSFNFIIIGSK
jgi:hypothetical protein